MEEATLYFQQSSPHTLLDIFVLDMFTCSLNTWTVQLELQGRAGKGEKAPGKKPFTIVSQCEDTTLHCTALHCTALYTTLCTIL
jgi:hypothetical protein